MKITKLEIKLIDYFTKYKEIICIILLSFLAIFLRITLLKFETSDYIYCLRNWFGHYQHYGISGLKFTIGDYNCIYNIILALLSYIPINSLYSIKFVSILFDFICAIYCGRIIFEITHNRQKAIFIYLIVLFIPTVIMNSALWAQCDSIYTAFAIMAIYYLIKKRYIISFICLGISFAFKLQFIFILPLFVIYYIKNKKFSITNFLFIPLMNILFALPSIILGRNIFEALFVYYYQAQKFSALVLKFPNIYNFLPDLHYFSYFGILCAFTCLVVLLYHCITKCKELSSERILLIAVYSTVIMTYFLPHMHERYMFIADILSVVWFIINRKMKNIYIPIVINLVSCYVYIHCVFNKLLISYNISSILYTLFIIAFSIFTYNELNDRKEKQLND